MKASPQSKKDLAGRWLEIEEIRLVSDLRIMHSRVDELHNVVENLKHKHSEADIVKYADYEVLATEYTMRTENLRIEVAGWLVNEYQITESKLEVRALDGRGRPFPDQRGAWRRLTARELGLHCRLETAIAQWFLEKTAAWDSDAAQQELRKGGVS